MGLLDLMMCSQGPSPALCLPLRISKFWLLGSKRQNSKETKETETSLQTEWVLLSSPERAKAHPEGTDVWR